MNQSIEIQKDLLVDFLNRDIRNPEEEEEEEARDETNEGRCCFNDDSERCGPPDEEEENNKLVGKKERKEIAEEDSAEVYSAITQVEAIVVSLTEHMEYVENSFKTDESLTATEIEVNLFEPADETESFGMKDDESIATTEMDGVVVSLEDYIQNSHRNIHVETTGESSSKSMSMSMSMLAKKKHSASLQLETSAYSEDKDKLLVVEGIEVLFDKFMRRVDNSLQGSTDEMISAAMKEKDAALETDEKGTEVLIEEFENRDETNTEKDKVRGSNDGNDASGTEEENTEEMRDEEAKQTDEHKYVPEIRQVPSKENTASTEDSYSDEVNVESEDRLKQQKKSKFSKKKLIPKTILNILRRNRHSDSKQSPEIKKNEYLHTKIPLIISFSQIETEIEVEVDTKSVVTDDFNEEMNNEAILQSEERDDIRDKYFIDLDDSMPDNEEMSSCDNEQLKFIILEEQSNSGEQELIILDGLSSLHEKGSTASSLPNKLEELSCLEPEVGSETVGSQSNKNSNEANIVQKIENISSSDMIDFIHNHKGNHHLSSSFCSLTCIG